MHSSTHSLIDLYFLTFFAFILDGSRHRAPKTYMVGLFVNHFCKKEEVLLDLYAYDNA